MAPLLLAMVRQDDEAIVARLPVPTTNLSIDVLTSANARESRARPRDDARIAVLDASVFTKRPDRLRPKEVVLGRMTARAARTPSVTRRKIAERGQSEILQERGRGDEESRPAATAKARVFGYKPAGAKRLDRVAGDTVSGVPSRTGLLLLNSAVAYALALMVTITLHEFGHALAALALGLTPTVRPSSVDFGSAPRDSEVITALAGPFVSLVTGGVLLFVSRAVRGRGFWQLVLLWLGGLGVQEFSGYLMTGPFVPFGDVGQAFQLLSAPGWVYGLACIVGVLGTVGLGALVTRWLLELSDPDAVDRSAQLRSLGLFAWLIGSATVLVTGGFDDLFSAVGFFELLGTLTVGIFLFWVRFFMDRQHVTPRGMRVGRPVVGVVLVVVVGLARHFILGPGLRL